MESLQAQIISLGIQTVAPERDAFSATATVDEINEAKRTASLNYFHSIKEPKTAAILVVNVDKDGRRDCIGPNAFAEIAVAFAEGREILTLARNSATVRG